MSISIEELNLIAKTVRALSIDGIRKANSGHPGMPLGCADIAAVLWGKIMNYNSDDPEWKNRDRFILSAGHGSMLLYSMLHLAGYDVTMEDLKNFRQMGSKTPGHPEFGHTVGVETTTGPLGQGFANGVGMAIAEKILAENFNSPGKEIIDHYIYAIAGDGCMMEGLTSEAASLAGHLGLGNLIYIYDSNRITIEGKTDITFSEDVQARFKSYDWHVLQIDGHDFNQIEEALLEAKAERARPSLIIAKTVIARGSASLEGSEESHGAPFSDDEIRATKEKIGCNPDVLFDVPSEVYEIFKNVNKKNLEVYNKWQENFNSAMQGGLREKWDEFFAIPDIAKLRSEMPLYEIGKSIATRSASGLALEVLYREIPSFIGGSADLGPSNKTTVKGISTSGKNKIGRSIHFGVRENAMGSIQNGIAYYGGFISFSATFFVFMDYMRPAVRLAALSRLQSIYVFTHDSVFVGEDGPTHQPIEHLAAARAIPNLNVIRPCDGEEAQEAWLAALDRKDGPTILALSRQNLPVLEKKNVAGAADLFRGAYIIHDYDNPDLIILSSGSEVHISIEAAEKLFIAKGIKARVVSFPCWEFFDKQDDSYKKSVLGTGLPRVVVEAGLRMGWDRYAGENSLFLTVDQFGRSASQSDLADFFGLNSSDIVKQIIRFLS